MVSNSMSSELLFFSKKKREEHARALARNSGGAVNMDELCATYFRPVLKQFHKHRFDYILIPIQKLIDENYEERNAQNLMLIGNSNSIVTLQTYRVANKILSWSLLSDHDIDYRDYSYAILNRIMMCMEMGKSLMLTDPEIISGSLYDLFNQNFLSEGNLSKENDKKNFTRISLGLYSNPMSYG
ncbi:e3 ubiquitin-protein ligase [Gigaspora margarita]|uniref:E3 ubiquitin-protein ligase n=1 Tax=Gigaspora margarita TaxID=4874 RepID=A0A8H4EV87_GIGMA|nr:e3 ubiquitin-protein ligase [Gigaspora margarita]